MEINSAILVTGAAAPEGEKSPIYRLYLTSYVSYLTYVGSREDSKTAVRRSDQYQKE